MLAVASCKNDLGLGSRKRPGRLIFMYQLLLLWTITLGALSTHATRIQPPPDLICPPSKTRLLAGTIANIQPRGELLRLEISTDWDTTENVDFTLVGQSVEVHFSERSPLKTSAMEEWLISHRQWDLRIWQCLPNKVALIELFPSRQPDAN